MIYQVHQKKSTSILKILRFLLLSVAKHGKLSRLHQKCASPFPAECHFDTTTKLHLTDYQPALQPALLVQPSQQRALRRLGSQPCSHRDIDAALGIRIDECRYRHLVRFIQRHAIIRSYRRDRLHSVLPVVSPGCLIWSGLVNQLWSAGMPLKNRWCS